MFGFIKKKAKLYFIDALGAMAQGLFCSLLIGTIIKTIGTQTHINVISDLLVNIGNYAQQMAGPAMAVSIGYAMKASPLVLFSLAAVGTIANSEGGAGGPLAVFFVAIIAAEFGMLVSKKTRIDILVTPAVTILVGGLISHYTAPAIGNVAVSFGGLIQDATVLQPLLMGILVSVLVGIALTLPISSAAICASLVLTGLAGGAAVAGCCAQMVGFAVMSYRQNKIGGLISQGLGTSMLQMPNIVRHPQIWVAPILTSAVTGPLATCVFKLTMNGAAVNSGMGTCGLCGPIGVITGWFTPSEAAIERGALAITPTAFDWIGLLLIAIVLPAVLTPIFNGILIKLGIVKPEYLKLPQ